MFGISLTEILLVMIIMLIVLGPEKLPSAARTFGKIMAELKKSSDAVRREFYNAVYTPSKEIREEIDEASGGLRTLKDEVTEELKLDPLCPDSKSAELLDASSSKKPENGDND